MVWKGVVEKPPYRVPRMGEIAALPKNGFSIVSTFSGCGGSCLGFEMDGYKVMWASEFIPAAQETYRANHPGVILDTKDIRKVTVEEILKAVGKSQGEIDVLEGSPPCASFSTAGKKEKGWGAVKKYSDTEQRTDDLFFEFIRILKGLMPKVFVAENVSGLVNGTAKGYFMNILQAMKDAGYVVEAQLLDASWLGVPQKRQRVIFIGVRQDLAHAGARPAFPKPFVYRYTVKDAIPGLVKAWEDTGGQFSYGDFTNEPSPTVRAGGKGHLFVEGVEPEAWLTGPVAAEWGRLLPGEQHEKRFNLVKADPDQPAPTIAAMWGSGSSLNCVVHPTQRRKFSIAELRRICGFPDDFILTGPFSKQWERLGRSVPPLMMFQVARTIRTEILENL